ALVRAYNQLHAKKYGDVCTETQTLDEFFYPLDKIENWNRLYGRRGFLQWQCVIPEAAGLEPVKAIFGQLQQQGIGAYLAVAKMFGDPPVTGLLSFPQAGITLALDFPNTGEALFRMLQRLDQIVLEAEGRLYPAKDARMSAAMFRASFPNWERFLPFIDPKISSSFSRRVLAPAIQYH
ncbi:MAG: FAD-binding protein, partial [Calditrichaeota bacterium]